MRGGIKGVRGKLLFINALSALLVLLVISALFVWQGSRYFQSVFEKRIDDEGRIVARNINAALLFEDWESAGDILSSLISDSAVISVRVEDNDGVAKLFQENHHIAVGGNAQVNNKAIYTSRVSVLHDGVEIGWLVIVASNDEVTSAVYRGLIAIVSIVLVSLSIGFVFSTWVQGQVVAPILSLSGLARKIHETKNYSLRCAVLSSDEVGQLTQDFNSMLEIVLERDQFLEKMVVQRTEELERKNSELLREMKEHHLSESARKEMQNRFEKAFNNAPIGMVIVNRDARFVMRNQAFDSMVGADAQADYKLGDFFSGDYLQYLLAGFEEIEAEAIDSFTQEATIITCKKEVHEVHLNGSGVFDDNGRFLYVVLQVQDVTEAKQLSEMLEYQAKHDVLTGLVNRRVFEDVFEKVHRDRRKTGSAVFCLVDLDQFKVINDSCGHVGGDELLKQLATLLQQQVRDDDLVIRLGGDEFGLMLLNCSLDMATRVAEKVRMAIENMEFRWEGALYRVGASIGVVAVTSEIEDMSDLLRKADVACFEAKDSGRNRVSISDAGNVKDIHRREGARWMWRLQNAIEQNYFVLYQQPVVSLLGGGMPHHEILIRLLDSDSGEVVPPGAFLPYAERYGLIGKIDAWVLDRLISCLQVNSQLLESSAGYWVNLSGYTFGDEQLVKRLEELVKESKLPAGMVNFEITESVVLRNLQQVEGFMQRMKSCGCRFALDDFGSGYASYGYLKKLPVDRIKIDGMFIRDITSDEIDRIFVKSIIDVARVMDIATVGEYVESPEIMGVLRELGANYGQGYAIARPQPLLQTLADGSDVDEVGSVVQQNLRSTVSEE